MPAIPGGAADPQRRRFLQCGVAGGCLLALAGSLPAASEEPGGAMLRAVAAALLDGALPAAEAARARAVDDTVAGVRQAVAGLAPAARAEVAQLFALLDFAPARILLAGVPEPWASAPPARVAAFLERWRGSRFRLLQSAYAGLHDLVLGTWYAQPHAWPAIGYPGPPEVA